MNTYTIKPEINILEYKYQNSKEYCITCISPKEKLNETINSFNEFIDLKDIKILQSFGFGNNQSNNDVKRALAKSKFFSDITWYEGSEESNSNELKLFFYCTDRKGIQLILENEKAIGTYVEDEDSYQVFFNNVLPENPRNSNREQASQVFNKMKTYLQGVNMEMKHIVRTWFYNNEILSWYDDFNSVRTEYYTEEAIFKHILPASTGIYGVIPKDYALTSSLIAFKPKNGNVKVREVKSPIQNEAVEYGSSFSRAILIENQSINRLTISGTASIDIKGNTVYVGEIENQVNHTIDSVKALLNESGMSLENVTRIFVYIKHKEHVDLCKAIIDNKFAVSFPVIYSNTIICRDNLLFEMELDAIFLK